VRIANGAGAEEEARCSRAGERVLEVRGRAELSSWSMGKSVDEERLLSAGFWPADDAGSEE
jgi:hypothetical protein